MSNNIETIAIERIPTWAIGYLMYGQAEAGLEDEDLVVVQAWEKQNPNLNLLDVDWETKNEFDPYPEFGLAGETVTCIFEKIN